MPTMDPWGNAKAKSLRLAPVMIMALVILPVIGYVAGGYLERHALNDPNTRLDVAIKALEEGYDKTALKLFQPLAETGNAKAQYHLAIMYEHGWGTPADPKKAVELYTKAAEQSLVPAQARLGEIYLRGTLVLQDLAKAREWCERAARAQDSDAELELADIYEHGLGVPQDAIEAYAWNALAARHGNSLAAMQRDRILRTLAPDQQAKAEARARALEGTLSATHAAAR
jgi:TPR repeat protein